MEEYDSETAVGSHYFERPRTTVPEKPAQEGVEVTPQHNTIASKVEVYKKASVRKKTYKVTVVDAHE